MRYYTDTGQIRADFAAQGSFWFHPDTLAFFGSRIERPVYGGRMFVTSEIFPDGIRRGTVREVTEHDNGRLDVRTVGEFGGYGKRADSHLAAKVHAACLTRTDTGHGNTDNEPDDGTPALDHDTMAEVSA